jgi:hypothetical protein
MRRSNSPINFVLRPALFSNLKNRREADAVQIKIRVVQPLSALSIAILGVMLHGKTSH